MKIALAAIEIPKDRPRRQHAGSYIDQLALSMASPAGQTDPIVVIQNGNSYLLVKGAARVAAARKLGWEDIEATPAHDFMPEQIEAHYAAATSLRAPLPPIEQWRAIVRLQDAGHDMDQAAAILGLTSRQALQVDRLGRMHPSVIKLIEDLEHWPNERAIRIIAAAPQDVQAKAVAAARKSGNPSIYSVADACTPQGRADRVDAIFDPDKVKMTWIEDVFAQPGERGHLTTPDLANFIFAQKAQLAIEKAARERKKQEVRIIETDARTGNATLPRGFNLRTYSPDKLDKPKKHEVVFLSVLPDGRVERFIAIDQAAEKAAAKAKEKVDKAKGKAKPTATPSPADTPADDTDPAGDDDDTPPAPVADISPITKAGRDLIAAAKTEALHAALRQDDKLDLPDLCVLLILALHAQNVTIAGYSGSSYFPSDYRNAGADLVAQLVTPEGHISANSTQIIDAGTEALTRVLKFGAVSRPVNGYNNNPDSGAVAEWIGAWLGAEAHLKWFDTAEFLATVNAAELRNAAAAAGIKPGKTATETRRLLTTNAPTWRPPGATFGAPGPRPAAPKPDTQQPQEDAA